MSAIVYFEYKRDICMGQWLCMQISSQTYRDRFDPKPQKLFGIFLLISGILPTDVISTSMTLLHCS